MPISLEQLPGESIIVATVTEPFQPSTDMPSMFVEFTRLRLAIQGPVALILDVERTTHTPASFSQMVFALAEAAKGIKFGKTSGVAQPPFLIFVGTGPTTTIAAQALEQQQYGGVRGNVCTSMDEALAQARAKLNPEP